MTKKHAPAVYNIRDIDAGTEGTITSTSHLGAAEDYAREAWKKHRRGSYCVSVSDGGRYQRFIVRVETAPLFTAHQVVEH